MADEPKIVEGVFASGNTGGLGFKSPLAKMIEHAMSVAIQKAIDAGITDPEVIKGAMMAARKFVREEYEAAVAKALEEKQ